MSKNHLHDDLDRKPLVPANIRCKELRLDIYQAYFVDGRNEESIAKELNLPLQTVKVAVNKMRS
jgi:DNA-binding transcriptional regulator LsrR (DeoR family)